MGAIEKGWVDAFNASPHHVKLIWKAHDDNYHTDAHYNAQYNERVWQCFAPHKDGGGAIHKNGKWIAFTKALVNAQLDAPMTDGQ